MSDERRQLDSEEERIIREFLEYRSMKEIEKSKRKSRWPKTLIIILLFILALFILAFVSSRQFIDIIYGPNARTASLTKSDDDYFEQARKAHYEEIKRLQAIEDEVLEDIRQKKYEEALIKAQTLVYTVNYSNDSKEGWDTKRTALIAKLEEYLDK